MTSPGPADKEPPAEWTYLTFDPEETCAICDESVHTGQAAGRVNGKLIHAKCYGPPRAGS